MQARNKMALSSESAKELQKTTVSWFEFLFDTSGNALKKHLESEFAGLMFISYSCRKIAEYSLVRKSSLYRPQAGFVSWSSSVWGNFFKQSYYFTFFKPVMLNSSKAAFSMAQW